MADSPGPPDGPAAGVGGIAGDTGWKAQWVRARSMRESVVAGSATDAGTAAVGAGSGRGVRGLVSASEAIDTIETTAAKPPWTSPVRHQRHDRRRAGKDGETGLMGTCRRGFHRSPAWTIVVDSPVVALGRRVGDTRGSLEPTRGWRGRGE